MPHFTLQFQAGGPQLNLFVGVSQPREQALRQANITIPQPTLVRGLVDTGASITAVDPAVIQALGLQPTGFMPVHTPSTGSTRTRQAPSTLALPFPCAAHVHLRSYCGNRILPDSAGDPSPYRPGRSRSLSICLRRPIQYFQSRVLSPLRPRTRKPKAFFS